MTGNTIYVTAAAKMTGDLTQTYRHLYESLMESVQWKSEATTIDGVHRAIEILMPNATPELKEQTRQDVLNFVTSFTSLTGLNVVELK